jgi:hypothetical protein
MAMTGITKEWDHGPYEQTLREDLEQLSQMVVQVDLTERVRLGSRRASVRRRLAGIGLVVLMAAAATTVLRLPSQIHIGPAGPTPAVSTPAVSTTAVPAPLPVPDMSPRAAGPWPNDADAAPDTTLDGQTVVVPEWPGENVARGCDGTATLRHGTYSSPTNPSGPQLRLLKAVPTSAGVVALFYCNRSLVGQQFQVVAYDKDGQGALTLRATVLASQRDGIPAMFDLAVAGDQVRIEIGDFADSMSVSRSRHYSVRQWRAYTWDGSRYAQVAGPTTFPPNPNWYDLAVQATALVFGESPALEGPHATMEIAISNVGVGIAPMATVTASLPDGAWLDPQTPPCASGPWKTNRGTASVSCTTGPIAPGSTVHLALSFRTAYVRPTTGYVSVFGGLGTGLGDKDDTNNNHPFAVTVH